MRTEDGYFINKCLNGDSEAFGFLVDRYKESVFAIAYSKLGNFHDAEDATQEVFAKAYSKLRTLRRWESFRVWLYIMTLNYCKMLLRSRSHRPDREFIEDQNMIAIHEPSVESDGNSQMNDSLHEALSKLPEIYRQVIILHYLGEMSTGEVAEFIGVSPGAVRMRLNRARIELREGILAMMSRTFEENKLQAGFTFQMLELVKRIKINANPMSRITGLSWGISSTTWLLIAILGFALNLSLPKPVIDLAQVMPEDMPTLRPSEIFIPVDVMKTSELSATSTKKDDTKDNQKSFALAPFAEGGKWERKADMPTARYSLSTSAVNGKIYAIGGSPDALRMISTVEEYDPIADIWAKKADMPTARYCLSTSTVNGKIYAIGGYNNGVYYATVEEYDPETDTWTKKANMSTAKMAVSTSVVDGKIYAIGGNDRNNIFSTVEEYDPVTDKWIKKANMPTARYQLSTCAVVGKIYAFGGKGWAGFASIVEEYDQVTDTWTKKADMQTARDGFSTNTVNGKMYAIGGRTEVGCLSILEEYDPVADTWTKKADMPTARYGISTSLIDGKIYVIGGATANWNPIYSTVEEYTPEGWPFNAIFPQNNLPSTWGEQKQER